MKVSTQLALCCLLFLFIGHSATAGDSVIYLGHGISRFCHAEKCFVYNNDLVEDGDRWESTIEYAAVLTADNDIVTLTVETGVGDQSFEFPVTPLELLWLDSENSTLVGLGTNVKARSQLIY